MSRPLHSLHQVRLGVVQDHKSLAEATSVTGVPFFWDWNSAIISVFPDAGSSYDASVNLADSYSVHLMYTSNMNTAFVHQMTQLPQVHSPCVHAHRPACCRPQQVLDVRVGDCALGALWGAGGVGSGQHDVRAAEHRGRQRDGALAFHIVWPLRCGDAQQGMRVRASAQRACCASLTLVLTTRIRRCQSRDLCSL